MTPSPIDIQIFETLQANAGADFVITLVEAFAEEAPRLVVELHQAASSGNAERFETAAHALKSNGVAFGATQLAQKARHLEQQGLAAGKGAIEALAVELAVVVAALRTLARQR
ncbi:MAG: Hpt domain-containing protein [Burkholderiales bacterium]|nr:Hpt domain-containing protein [Burkholderiales bacterium]